MGSGLRRNDTLMPLLLLAIAFVLSAPLNNAVAQRVDSVGVRARSGSVQDSVGPRPISPGSAFLGSFLLPGYSQSKLQRPTAMVIFAGMEVVGWAMLRRSVIDLRRAKRFARDSVVSEYSVDATTGIVLRDSTTGKPLLLSIETDQFSEALIPARQRHVEDWAAIIIFNHLIAGVDALVASHLWEVPVRIRASSTQDGQLRLGGSLKW